VKNILLVDFKFGKIKLKDRGMDQWSKQR